MSDGHVEHFSSGTSFGNLREVWKSDPYFDNVWTNAQKLDRKEKVKNDEERVSLINFCKAFILSLQKGCEHIDEMCLAAIMADLEGVRNFTSADGNDLGTVSKDSFYKLHLYFGNPPISLRKMRDVMERGINWFHGNKTKELAQQQLLEQKQDNLFLVRYSTSKGAFTIDYKKRGQICRFNNIENTSDGKVEVTIGRPGSGNERKYTYTYLSSFITKNSHVFGEPFVDFNSKFQWLKVRLSTPDSFPTLHDYLRLNQGARSGSGSNSGSILEELLPSKKNDVSITSLEEKSSKEMVKSKTRRSNNNSKKAGGNAEERRGFLSRCFSKGNRASKKKESRGKQLTTANEGSAE